VFCAELELFATVDLTLFCQITLADKYIALISHAYSVHHDKTVIQ